jgi:hypothetical protein
MNNNKIYINLPFILKEKGKELGAKYDIVKKLWYIVKEEDKHLFELIEVDIPYELKDKLKS